MNKTVGALIVGAVIVAFFLFGGVAQAGNSFNATAGGGNNQTAWVKSIAPTAEFVWSSGQTSTAGMAYLEIKLGGSTWRIATVPISAASVMDGAGNATLVGLIPGIEYRVVGAASSGSFIGYFFQTR